MKYKNILLLVPAESASGGIKNYFQVLKKEFRLPVEYMIRGARNLPYRKSFFKELKRAYIDLNLFRNRIGKGDIGLVQTSTSLGMFSVIRDGLFLYFANKKNIKTIVFFRGWDVGFEKKISKYFLLAFKFLFFRVDSMVVLSPSFKSKLQEWGFKKEIHIESTIIDKNIIDSINLSFLKKYKFKKNNTYNILFLARVEIAKGIYEAIEAYSIVKNNNKNLHVSFTIAGDGKELDNVKKYIAENEIKDIEIMGHISGESKKQCFLDANVYLLPSYTEGMPNSVLEAMAFGLPIVTRSVGAIPDIIKKNKNGFHTLSKDPLKFANFIQQIIDNPELSKRIMEINHTKAINNYTTKVVVDRIEKIYKELLNETTNPTT